MGFELIWCIVSDSGLSKDYRGQVFWGTYCDFLEIGVPFWGPYSKDFVL